MSYTQTLRPCALSTPLGDDALLLRKLAGTERVSELPCFELELASEAHALHSADVLGLPAAVRIALADGTHRIIQGIFTEFARDERRTRFSHYRATLRPLAWLLTQRIDTRIFQHLSVPDIVARVLQAAGLPHFEFRLSGTYSPHEYCVQYRESDLDFIQRLLEEEGIHYYLEHRDGEQWLVFADATTAAALVAGEPRIQLEGTSGGAPERDAITSWIHSGSLHPTHASVKDFNFEDPHNPLTVDVPTLHRHGHGARLDSYEHHAQSFGNLEGGEQLARLRMERAESSAIRIHGESRCRAFGAGMRFTPTDHHGKALEVGACLLLSVEHELVQGASLETGEDSAVEYTNRFTCVPVDTPYRPERRTPRPAVQGPQTAIVVGPAGEEIHVDDYGRIKVRFHWDRLAPADDTASCWIRVSQSWAGRRWGAVTHPRIGDEVLVEFLDGDPDNPIVTGSVYNAYGRPPYPLPADKTVSGIRSNSSPGGTTQNFNEIRIEDRKGEELLSFQAEKDRSVLVKNDNTETVQHDETVSVGNDRSKSIQSNETVSIGSNRTTTVGAEESVTVGGSRTLSIASDDTITVGSNRTIQVGANSTEVVGANRVVKAGGSVLIDAGTSLTLKCGAATIHMNAAGVITISGSLVTMTGAMSANVVSPLTNVIGAAMLTTNGALNLVNGFVTRVHGSSLAHLGGGSAEVVGDGETRVSGSTVKIN